MGLAASLNEAIDVLQPEPIEPDSPWYVRPEVLAHSGRKLAPLAELRAQLLNSRDSDRYLLSGHLGSGKSTELKRLLADPEIQKRFYVVQFAVEPTALPSLTSHHLLFLIASELYRRASSTEALTAFDKKDRWLDLLQRMNTALYGPDAQVARSGKFGLEFDLFFVKLRQELNVDEARRKEFRNFAETQGSVLVDLIDALVDDLRTALGHAGLPARVLVAVDDLEKVQHEAQLREMFDTNLGAFLAPQVPLLVTVPPSITFGGSSTPLGRKVIHLRPVQVLKKEAAKDPLGAADPHGIDLLRRVLAARVEPQLFEPGVVDEAAVYSGGVLREFFYLLRTAAIQASYLYGQDTVDAVTFEDVLVEERNKLARTLYPADREALREIHATHALSNPDQLDYMRRSVVLEYNHDAIWFDVAPLLWQWLDRK
ncbi:hypothetical protein [Chondromyces apiculatus]|uniref:Type II secretory pathway, ATPase PulE/Tfp pilus assembly pathway, ATPase PilB n=1 Tax=Chondromyces apiculatus DSM 436 TaxID=1192034 RepID=A0A017SX38_9BACT|nr:hypothetical protein [Chondromyces apiculatus]EYF01519.1 Type II secretory pathway, ATPase PulE/Tfp pilus assembly pathway, ATPase PilB [Chondromyces apiculatus DSM 436]